MAGLIMGAVRITSTPARGFDGYYRLGQFWPAAGRTVAEADFSPEDWAVLASDPRLTIATVAEEAPAAEAEAALRGRIRDVFPQLEAADFGKTGDPKVAAVRLLLPEDVRAITAALVAEVWADVKSGP